MAFDLRQQFTYHPGEEKKPSQPTPATNPWTTPQPSAPSTQRSNAWNPWTNPPAPAPSPNTSPNYVHHPVSSSAAQTRQQSAAPNPWTNPPAPTPSISISSNWSHQAVYSPYFTHIVRPDRQSASSSLWPDQTSTTIPSCIRSRYASLLSQWSRLLSSKANTHFVDLTGSDVLSRRLTVCPNPILCIPASRAQQLHPLSRTHSESGQRP